MQEKEKQIKGFSLIEILVTIFILGAILLTLLPVFIYGFNLVSRTKQTTLATQLAQLEFEFIRNVQFDQIQGYVDGTSDFIQANKGTDQRYEDFDLSLLQNVAATLAWQDDLSDSVNIIKLTATITWDYRGQQMKKDMVTYLFKDGISK